MSKSKHPHSRAERRRLKLKKDKLNGIDKDFVYRRIEQEALEQKEALDALRKQVLAVEEEERTSP